MLYSLIYTLVTLSFSTVAQNNEQIKKAILAELNHYPEAQLVDIYKNFFQDAYGPGHLIPDTTHAGNYLNLELKEIIEDTLNYQPIGPNNDYYRINLQLVKDGILPRGILLDGMIESAKLARNPDLREWKKEWATTLLVIDELDLNLRNFEKDKKIIDEVLAKDEYVIHHSNHYKDTYKRHYRIIHKSVFQRWKGNYFD